MNKLAYRLTSICMLFALTFGSYANAGASSALPITKPQKQSLSGILPLANAAASSDIPVGQTGNWDMVFSDEFNDTTLSDTWSRQLWWGNGITGQGIGEQENYIPSKCSESAGNAVLKVVNTPSGGRPFSSCILTTGGIQNTDNPETSFTYGYFESRIKMPSGAGMWPAFWLWPQDHQDPPEIDIIEWLGVDPTVYYSTQHFDGGSKQFVKNTDVDLSSDFHVYAANWTPEYIAYYFDGVEIGRYKDSAHYFSKPMYIILNLAMGGSWAGNVDTSKLPASMLVDYVRVWKPGINITSTPTPTNGNSVDVRVSAGRDDVEENSSGGMYMDSSDLELIYDDSAQVVGMRFTNLEIPAEATITNAYIQFKTDETSNKPVNLTIFGQASTNAGAFTRALYNVSKRPKTLNSVSWSPPAWLKVGQKGKPQRTPNLAPIVQEIVDQTNWISGNSIVMIILGKSGKRVAESFEGDSAGAPLLHVEFTMTAQAAQVVPITTFTATTSPTAIATFTQEPTQLPPSPTATPAVIPPSPTDEIVIPTETPIPAVP